MPKYKAILVERWGIKFASKVELAYYLDHKDNIAKVHPSYLLQEWFVKYDKKYRPIYYIADFELLNGDVIDVKWMPTETAILKRKLFDCKYPDQKLIWISYIKKYGGWIEYDDLVNFRKQNKWKTVSL